MASYEQLDDFTVRITACQDLEQAGRLFRNIINSLGCKEFTFTFYSKDFHTTGDIKHELTSDYMRSWHQHFVDNDYECVDPVGKRVKQNITPVNWDLQEEYKQARAKAKRMFAEAMDYGLRTGVSMPFFSPTGESSILVIHDEDIESFFASDKSLRFTINQLGMYYHQHIYDLLSQENPQSEIQLTKREIECLTLTAHNKTAAEIAEILNITPRTVGFHVENANDKLGCKSKYQTVQKAISLGLVVP